MSVQDLVLSLTALGAVLAMTAVVLEEASALEAAEEAELHMQRQVGSRVTWALLSACLVACLSAVLALLHGH